MAVEKSLFETLCDKVDEDFAILSDTARQKIKDMIQRMADDAYYRGLNRNGGDARQ